MNPTISCSELYRQIGENAPFLVIDILTPEDYEAGHLPGAVNACVYEMIFPERMAEVAPDRAVPLVIYDATGTTRAATTAVEKLQAAGYRDIRILEGGRSGWCTTGYPLEGSGRPLTDPVLTDGRYDLDTVHSVLEWTGRNINNSHYGRIPLKEGTLTIEKGNLARGRITLDMKGISNLDLQDETYRHMLVRHLLSDDFFDAVRYPYATIDLHGWQPIPDAALGTPDHLLHGELTIKNVTRTVKLPATVMPQEDGSIKAQAVFDIDRTDWNITYGSGRFFEKLGMHLVHDRIDIELFLVARPAG